VPETFDLLVLGDANPDLVLTGDVDPAFGQVERLVDQARLTIGGSAAIVAAGAARLGLHAGFCGVVGDDLFGRFMRDELARRNVDVRGLVTDRDRPTGLTVVLARPNDRAILTHRGTIGDLDIGRIDAELLARARHVHVGSFFLQPRLASGLTDLFERVHAGGGTTSVDPNWDPSERWNGGLREILPFADVFLPNATEAIRTAGVEPLDEALRALAVHTPLVVAKVGLDGAIGVQGDRLIRALPPHVNVVDTTGSGDSFDAGFLASWLAGDPLERSLAVGNACGALSTRALGGVDSQPTMEEAIALLPGPAG
jgi:sugar/nucleoside kinase (ribokinase family)